MAGDAAHQFPATGIGINAGMLDAVNLGWKLAATVQGLAPEGLLDTYHDERHVAGERTLMHTQAQAALRREDDPAIQALRQLLQELMMYDEPLRHMGELIAAADIRYASSNGDAQHALTGHFVPDLLLTSSDGTTSVAEILRTARPTLLDVAGRSELRDVSQDWHHCVDIITATTDDRPADALLIRPDGHVGWAAAVNEDAAIATVTLRDALTRWFGSPPRL